MPDYYSLAQDIVADYTGRNAMYKRMDDLYFQRSELAEDETDEEVQRVTMPYGTNVVDLIQDLAAVRAITFQVPASSEAKTAKQKADLLEKWFGAWITLSEREQRSNFRKDAAWYAAQRGCVVARVLYTTQKKSSFPLILQLRDPATTYFRWDIRPTAVVEKYDRPAWQIQQLYPGVLDADATGNIEWMEYWDETTCAYWAGGAPVSIGGAHVRKHLYGCMPYTIAKARGTPLASDRYRPVLLGVEKVIANLDTLSSIIATAGMASVASAWAVYSKRYGPDSGRRELDLTPNSVNYFDPSAGEDVKPLQRASLPADFFQLFSTFLQAFQQGTIPLSLFGESSSHLAGYAINLLTQQGQRTLGPIWEAIEAMHEDVIVIASKILREVVGPAVDGDIPLFVNETRQDGQVQRLYRREIKLDWRELGDDFDVVCKLESPVPADLSNNLRQAMEAWKSGFLSKETALQKFSIVPDPTDEIDRAVIEQMYMQLAQKELEEVARERGYLPEEVQAEKTLSPDGGPVSGAPTPLPESLGGPGAFPPQAAMQQMAPMTPAALPEMRQMAGEPAVPLPGQQEGPR